MAMPHATRVDDVDVAALTAFLGSCPPFDSLGQDDLDRIVVHAAVERYAAGSVVRDALAFRADELVVVWAGRVNVWNNADRLTELPDQTEGAGGFLGLVPSLAGEAVGQQSVAVGDVVVVRLPAEQVASVFASRRGTRFLAQEVSSSSRRAVGVPDYTLVDDLVTRQPLVIDGHASIAGAAAEMAAADLGYAAVQLAPGRYGLITDATIRRVVAAAEPTSLSVVERMDHNPPVTRLGASATEALVEVLEHDAEYVLVTDRAGELHGVVAPIDFVVSSTTAGASLHEQLRRATTVAELQDRYRRVPQLIGDLTRRGLASSRVITVQSALADTLVRRAIQLVMQPRPDLSTERFTWLSLGSNGRREAVLSSDMDAAAAFADGMSESEIARYRPVFGEITDVITAAGLKHDTNGVGPWNLRFARTHRQWEAAARAWLSRPADNKAIIMTCLLVDGRPIHGDLGLPEVARVFGELRHHPTTMEMLLAVSVDRADTWRGRWRRKSVDLKKQALLPISNMARWAALSAGSPVLETPERLKAAAGTEFLAADDAETLGDVFEIVQRMRVRHQLEQIRASEEASDVVTLRDLSTVEAAVLTDAVREVRAVQRRMANKARYVLPALHDIAGR